MNGNFHCETDPNGIVWLSMDKSDSDTNVLTTPLLEELDGIMLEIGQEQRTGLVIRSAKQGGFIAGADVKAFAGLTNAREAKAVIHQAQAILQRIESLPFPTVALIHGYCLGGGLELALACDYRVACNEADTRIGFPETRLGLFPGFGGTVRATRIAGPLNALPLMLSGRAVDARTARQLGLVDQVQPRRQLNNAARRFIRERPAVTRPSRWQQLGNRWPLRPLAALYLHHRLKKQVNPDHYPAPHVLLRHWSRHGGNADTLYHSEAREVAGLIASPTAQQLIRVFLLQDRLKSLGDRHAFNPAGVHVVGGGTMGADIAAWCALKGFGVTLQDNNPEQLGRAVLRADKLFKRHLKNPYQVQQAMDRLTPDREGDGVARADVVIEAIFENPKAKRALYAQLEPAMRSEAILASNTSGIPLRELVHDLVNPRRLVGLHFFNPVARMPLVEVVSDDQTDADTLNRVLSFSRQIDKLPLPVRSSPGFLVNRVLMPYLLAAVNLLEEGHAPETIDRAAVAFGMPMGPIELADRVGLDVCLSVAQELKPESSGDVPAILVTQVENGRLGRKIGTGFYTWKAGRPQHKRRLRLGGDPDRLIERMIPPLLNEARTCLSEGVVADPDLVDAGILFGTGFAPFRGGPLNHLRIQQKRLERDNLGGHPAPV